MRIVWLAAVFSLAGCSGLQLKTLSSTEVERARTSGGTPLDGYVVYEPLVAVKVGNALMCPDGSVPDAKNPCAGAQVQCVIGDVMKLPDYGKPYLVSVQNGFGKAGVDVAIAEGWMLGHIKDNSDNTAMLTFLKETLTLGVAKNDPTRAADGSRSCTPDLYRVTASNEGLKLNRLIGPTSVNTPSPGGPRQ